MTIRTRAGVFLLKCARLVHLAIPVLLSPESLIEFNRFHFGRTPGCLFPSAETGLFPQEEELLNHLGIQSGEALCLASGAGREAFALARRGLKVLGVDQVSELIRFAIDYANANHLPAEFLEQDISRFEANGREFDHIFLLNHGYSYLPTRRLRVELLTRLRESLRPGGRCILSVLTQAPSQAEVRRFPWLRGLGVLVRGNSQFELGDQLLNESFVHMFSSQDAVRSEVQEAGFPRIEFFVSVNKIPYAILFKDLAPSLERLHAV